MNAVGGIVLRLGLSPQSFLEMLIERNEYVRKLLRELIDDGENGFKILSYSVLVLAVEKVGSYHHDLGVSFGLELCQNSSVIELDLLVRRSDLVASVAMPDVVDTDEDRDDIGIERDSVLIKTVEELIRTVSADSEIDELKIGVVMCLFYKSGCVFGITAAHIEIISFIASGIGYAVTLKQNSHNCCFSCNI